MLAACMGALLSAVGDRGGGGHAGSHGVRSCFQVTRDRDCGGRPKAAVRPLLTYATGQWSVRRCLVSGRFRISRRRTRLRDPGASTQQIFFTTGMDFGIKTPFWTMIF